MTFFFLFKIILLSSLFIFPLFPSDESKTPEYNIFLNGSSQKNGLFAYLLCCCQKKRGNSYFPPASK